MDITELILVDHDRQRRGFALSDEAQGAKADNETVQAIWDGLAVLLDAHADAEEKFFYPRLLDLGKEGDDETEDAIGDHNDIRDAVRAAGTHRAGSQVWWSCVADARTANSDHMGEEERGALADIRRGAPLALRRQLGLEFAAYEASRAGGQHIDRSDKDPDIYIEDHG
ncbi:MAG: cation-binding protein [Acidimicrobiales bacterium]|nr:MAG: cation-binding protein [Acidimicrobiales bacterium]